jgi:hypothetical protein
LSETTTIVDKAVQRASEYEGDTPALREEIDEFAKKYNGYRKKNAIGDRVLIYGGIILSACVPLSVLFKNPSVGAVLGVIVAVLITIQNAQALGAKASFYELVSAQAGNLGHKLSFGHISDREFTAVLKEFLALRIHAVENRPRGQGMAVVSAQGLGRDLEKVKNT